MHLPHLTRVSTSVLLFCGGTIVAASAQAQSPAEVELLWTTRGSVVPASASPATGRVCTVEGNPGVVVVRGLQDSSFVALTSREEGMPEFCVASPDGNRVAYDWLDWSTWLDGWQVRLQEPSGSVVTVVPQDSIWSWIRPLAWSPDGTLLAIERWQLGDNYSHVVRGQLALVSVADGRLHVVGPELHGGIGFAGFEPGGQVLAFDMPGEAGSGSHDLFVVDIEGGSPASLQATEADERLFGFSADGAELLYWTDEGGGSAVVRRRFDSREGRLSGRVRRVMDGPASPVGVLGDGRLVAAIQTDHVRLFVAAVEAGVPNMRDLTEIHLPDEYADIQYGDWSPDGGSIAIIARRAVPPVGGQMHEMQDALVPDRALVVYDVLSGLLREVQLSGSVSPYSSPRWMPDGRRLLLVGQRPREPKGIFSVDLEDGTTRPLFIGGLVHSRRDELEISPDGRSLYFPRETGRWPAPVEIVRYALDTGESVVLHTMPWLPLALALSPDGSHLAVSPAPEPSGAFGILDTSRPGSIRGSPRPAGGRVVSLSWTPEGEAVLFTVQQEWLRKHTVWRRELATGTAAALDYGGPGVVRPGPWSGNPRFSPSGDRLLLIAGSPTFDVVMITPGG